MTTADRAAFWVAYLQTGKTRPMTKSEVCAAFGYERSSWDDLMPYLDGIEPFRNRWRLPLTSMPAEYFLRLGVPAPSSVNPDAGLCGNVSPVSGNTIADEPSMGQSGHGTALE